MVKVMFSLRITLSIGLTIIVMPIEDVEFYIVKVNTPFLFSLANINYLYVYFNNFINSIVISYGNIPVIRRFGHSFIL